jgi:hypothetical protein
MKLDSGFKIQWQNFFSGMDVLHARSLKKTHTPPVAMRLNSSAAACVMGWACWGHKAVVEISRV